MPVLITIATINLFFGSGSGVSFLNPDMLRARCEKELKNSDAQGKALVLVDELEQLARQYDKSLAATLESYIEETSNPESTATDLIAKLDPWDNNRRSTMHEIILIRQSMLDLLSASEWDQVFG